MKKLNLGMGALMAVTVLFSCGEKVVDPYPGYDKLDEASYIKYHNKNDAGRKVQIGDILSLNMKYTTSNDSVLFNSKDAGRPLQLRADSGKYTGDFIGVLLGMKQGDSASIKVNADSFFIKTAGMPESPDFIDSASMLTFEVGISKVENMEEMQAAQAEEAAKAEGQEMVMLKQYLGDNGITQAPTESGLIFISKKKGTGKKAEAGKTVQVHYEGMLLNGTYFDTSVESVAKEQGLYDERRAPYAPFEFELGKGMVIKGWDEGIAMMKEGGKAKLIIPSSIGYGGNTRPGGPIPPFATLVFDVELIKVMD